MNHREGREFERNHREIREFERNHREIREVREESQGDQGVQEFRSFLLCSGACNG
jgi:hypothetical protein